MCNKGGESRTRCVVLGKRFSQAATATVVDAHG